MLKETLCNPTLLLGKTKSNQGWTPLHLASYFGHRDVTELLLQHGAGIDELNDAGDTPLHKAALTNREVSLDCPTLSFVTRILEHLSLRD